MLFAAGFGTRMGALTATRPKPLIPVAGKPLIDHALDLVNAYRPARIVANLHYLPEKLADHLSTSGVALSLEQPDILETGGGLRTALPLLGPDPVFTMNTDAIWRGPNPLSLLADLWNPERMDALLLCVPKTHAFGHTGAGDFLIGQGGRATRGPGQVYTGLQIIKTDRLHTIPQPSFSLNLLWDQMLAENSLYVAQYHGKWCDVGRPDSIDIAEDMLSSSDV